MSDDRATMTARAVAELARHEAQLCAFERLGSSLLRLVCCVLVLRLVGLDLAQVVLVVVAFGAVNVCCAAWVRRLRELRWRAASRDGRFR